MRVAHAGKRPPERSRAANGRSSRPSSSGSWRRSKDDWPNIEGPRRNKWVEIAKRYPEMTPQQQERLQSRMKQWASMSPEERAQVRDRYKKLKDMPPEKREAIQPQVAGVRRPDRGGEEDVLRQVPTRHTRPVNPAKR